MSWKHRHPTDLVIAFYTKKDRYFAFSSEENRYLQSSAQEIFSISDVISISTTNSINASSGTFTIELVWRLGDNGKPLYYDSIRPLDIVDISLGKNITTMVGMVNRVRRKRSISGGKIKRSIIIEGKSLGTIWEFDLIKYFVGAHHLTKAQQDRNLLLQEGAIKYDFTGKSAAHAIKTIYQVLPALDIEYFGGRKLSSFIDVGSELFTREGEKVFLKKADPYQGTMFDYFRKYVGQPFNEIWTESKNHKLYLRMRPTPFCMGASIILKGTEDNSKITLNPNFYWQSIPDWYGEQGVITISYLPASSVFSENLSRDHYKSYSIFGVLPQERIHESSPEYSIFPPLIVPELLSRFGSRDLVPRIGFLPMNSEGGLKGSYLGIFKYYRNLLYLWNKDNHKYESGTLTIKGNPIIVAGEKLNYGDKEYYIVGVSHSWKYGQIFTSTLRVERGMGRKERLARYNSGLEYLLTSGQAV